MAILVISWGAMPRAANHFQIPTPSPRPITAIVAVTDSSQVTGTRKPNTSRFMKSRHQRTPTLKPWLLGIITRAKIGIRQRIAITARHSWAVIGGLGPSAAAASRPRGASGGR